MMRRGARRRAATVVALLWSVTSPAAAEFFRWIDAGGQIRISNVPPRAMRTDGSIAAASHPYSVAAQHDRMRNRLQQAGRRLEREAIEASRDAALLAPESPGGDR